MFRPLRLSLLRRVIAGAGIVAVTAAIPAAALAQVSSECQKGIELFKARISWIQKIQALPKKGADPVVACSLFTKLGSANATVLSWSKTNQAWCSIEENQIIGLQNEAKQVAGIRAKACSVAAQYTKLKQQAMRGAQQGHGGDDGFNVDMHSDPLAPPVKIPPSAL